MRHGTVANPARPVLGSRPPNLSGSSRIGNRRQSSCSCELLCYFFLNFSKIDISENLRFLARSFSPSWVLTCSVESKPNSRMIKMNRIGVVLIVFSIIDKKSPRPGCQAEHRATDSRLRTRRKRSSLIPEQLSLSSRSFLKHSKIDISGNLRFSSEYCERRTKLERSAIFYSETSTAWLPQRCCGYQLRISRLRLVKNEGRWDSLKRWIGNSIRRIARSSHNWPDPIVARSRPRAPFGTSSKRNFQRP